MSTFRAWLLKYSDHGKAYKSSQILVLDIIS